MSNTLIEQLLKARRIVILGISDNPAKPSHAIAEYLMSVGYEIVPVNPSIKTMFNKRCFASLAEVEGPIDLVNVFRRSEFIPQIVADSIEVRAGGVWVQSGIISAAAAELAARSNLRYLENKCIMVEHARRY